MQLAEFIGEPKRQEEIPFFGAVKRWNRIALQFFAHDNAGKTSVMI
jgi:hypothetical protein